MKKVRILCVCMGNICRSPTAHGVFEALVERENLNTMIHVDSAGTHAYHVGEPPDKRAQETARKKGFDLSGLRARQAVARDFHEFDLVVAMDQDNYHSLYSICPEGMEDQIHLLMDYAPEFKTREVPDPYYGGTAGFERVFDMVEAAASGLLEEIRRRHFA